MCDNNKACFLFVCILRMHFKLHVLYFGDGEEKGGPGTFVVI